MKTEIPDWTTPQFPYSEYRCKIKNGDLLAYNSNSLMGKVVKTFTRSKYSHVSIAIWIGDRLFALEVMPPCVLLLPLSTVDKLFLLPMDVPNWTEEHFHMVLRPIGTRYSYIGALLGLFDRVKEVDSVHQDSWQCAQYVSFFYQKLGLDFGWQGTPKEVVNKALSLNGKVVYELS